MNIFLKISLFLFLAALYCFALSLIFARPISFTINNSFSIIGFLLEFISLVVCVYLVLRFHKKYGLYNTLSFFIPIFLMGILLEGDFIVHHKYIFHKLNFSFWDTPIAVTFYWSGIYLLYCLYQYLGKGLSNRIKGMVTHLAIDVLITTPLAILFGFWSFEKTLFNSYPYIAPVVSLGEVSIGFLYVLFQEWLISRTKINGILKPIISLTTIFCFLVMYKVILSY